MWLVPQKKQPKNTIHFPHFAICLHIALLVSYHSPIYVLPLSKSTLCAGRLNGWTTDRLCRWLINVLHLSSPCAHSVKAKLTAAFETKRATKSIKLVFSLAPTIDALVVRSSTYFITIHFSVIRTGNLLKWHRAYIFTCDCTSPILQSNSLAHYC